jgi:hypothetical protein
MNKTQSAFLWRGVNEGERSGTAFRLEFGFGRRSGWNGLEFVGEKGSWSSLQNFSIYTTVLVPFSADNKVHNHYFTRMPNFQCLPMMTDVS